MSVPILNRMSNAFNIASTSPVLDITIDQKDNITLTKKQETKTDPELLIDRVIQGLERFIQLEKIEGEDLNKKEKNWSPLKPLKKNVRTFFKGKLKKSNPKMRMLFLSLFPLAKARWKLARGIDNFPVKGDSKDYNHEEKVLAGKMQYASRDDLENMSYPRDILFLQQQLQVYLKRLIQVQSELCKRLSEVAKENVAISRIDDEPLSDEDDSDDEMIARALFFGEPRQLLVESQLQEEVKKVCSRLVTERIIRSDKISRVVSPLLKQLVSYKNESPDNKAFVEESIKVIELNELVATREHMLDEWARFEFSSRGYTDNKKSKKPFKSITYLPRRHLLFLEKLGGGFVDYIDSAAEESISDTLAQQQRICELCYTVLKRFEPDPQEGLYKKLEKALEGVVKKFLHDWPEGAQAWREVIISSIDLKPSDPDYEEHVWRDIAATTYSELVKTGRVEETVLDIHVPKLFKNLENPIIKAVSADRGYGIVQQRKIKQQTKKIKPRAVGSCPIPTTTGDKDMEQLTASLAKTTLKAVSAPVQESKVAPPQTLKPKVASEPTRKKTVFDKPVVTATAKLKYDIKVLRWRKERLANEDPLRVDPSYYNKIYTPREKIWVYVKHNFGDIVDDFLALGVHDRDGRRLDKYKASERIQIACSIAKMINGRKETRKGFVTYTKSRIDHVWKHRYFKKNDDNIDNEYAERAWKFLKNPPKREEGAPQPNLVAKDKSYVEYQSKDLIVIYDPKNHARIQLVPYKPYQPE